MKEIKDIIAENLINLRKSKNLTQIELAERLNYSDNMVSRWERAEITPSIETLQKISEFYAVPLELILRENITQNSNKNQRIENIKKFSIILMLVMVLWFLFAVAFVYVQALQNKSEWTLFVLAVPLSCLVMLLFNGTWNKYIYRFVLLSVFIWSFLAYFYLYFLEQNLFLIFIIGFPAQMALVIWAFIKPKNMPKKEKTKRIKNTDDKKEKAKQQ